MVVWGRGTHSFSRHVSRTVSASRAGEGWASVARPTGVLHTGGSGARWYAYMYAQAFSSRVRFS